PASSAATLLVSELSSRAMCGRAVPVCSFTPASTPLIFSLPSSATPPLLEEGTCRVPLCSYQPKRPSTAVEEPSLNSTWATPVEGPSSSSTLPMVLSGWRSRNTTSTFGVVWLLPPLHTTTCCTSGLLVLTRRTGTLLSPMDRPQHLVGGWRS